MLSGVDPLEGVLDTKSPVHILELFAAVVHAIIVEDGLHATAATDGLVCLIKRLLEST